MTKRKASVGCLVGLVCFCVGCNDPFAGTSWNVVELWGPDSANYPDFASMVVEFRRDGRVITTTTYKDGRKTVEDQERYSVDVEDNLLTLKTGDREIVSMYRFDFDGKRVRVHSERFIVLADLVEK